MSARARARDAKGRPTEPFASLRQDVLALDRNGAARSGRADLLAGECFLGPDEIRRGNSAVSGTARASVASLQRPHRPNRKDRAIIVPSTSTVCDGLRHLLQPINPGNAAVPSGAKGYLVQTTLGGRPGGQGGAARLASEYDVPTGTAPIFLQPRCPSVRRPEGKLRPHAERIRCDIARMSETEVAVSLTPWPTATARRKAPWSILRHSCSRSGCYPTCCGCRARRCMTPSEASSRSSC